MNYMLMIYRDEEKFAQAPRQGAHSAAYVSYAQSLRDAGILVSGDRLQVSETASTVRVAGGRAEVLDGPYSETREQLGGFYIINVDGLDAALDWARKCPGAVDGAVEVRPMWQP